MSEFDNSLEDWKGREDHADAMILLHDQQLLKYAGLWRSSMRTSVSSYPIDSSWFELWECVDVNYKRLADMADEPENRARFQIRRLVEMRLIYPDGTRTEMATKAVIKFMADRLA